MVLISVMRKPKLKRSTGRDVFVKILENLNEIRLEAQKLQKLPKQSLLEQPVPPTFPVLPSIPHL